MDPKQVADEFLALLKTQAAEMGQELTADLEEVRDYAAQRLEHLSGIVREAGFMEAARAEADSVLLKATARAIDRADAADARLLGIAEGALLIGAKALDIAL